MSWRTPLAVFFFIAVSIAAAVGLQIARARLAAEHRVDPASHDVSTAKEEDEKAGPDVVQLSPESMRKYGIRVASVKKHKLVSEIRAPGRITFDTEATAIVGSPVQGRVLSIKVRAGDVVAKGDELLTLESVELGEAQCDFLLKLASVATTRSALGPATSIYERTKQLYDEKHLIGVTELQKCELDLRQAEGAAKGAETAGVAAADKLRLLGMSRSAIDELATSKEVNPRYVVRSPRAGQIIERTVNLGELVKPEREKLFVVADTSTLWALADVPESRAAEVSLGCAAQITPASSGSGIAGTVSYIAPKIDDTTRCLQVRIELKNTPALRPGMFVQTEIAVRSQAETDAPVLCVPESALQTLGGGAAVFLPVAAPPNAFQARPVVVGAMVNGMATVASGLQEGERVVTAGAPILKAELLKSTAKDDD